MKPKVELPDYLIVRLFIFCFAILTAISPVYASRRLLAGDESRIRNLMQKQVDAWNAGNLEKFMETYLKSDQLVFIGKNGPKYGWQETLDNYRKSYPSRDAMGKLNFDILKIDPISRKAVFLTGKYHLTRIVGDVEGYFTLVIKKVGKEWLIVSDHSSSSVH